MTSTADTVCYHSVLIVGGGGTIGSSTALHLHRRGYTNIHLLDAYPIPSAQSAGYDLNKLWGSIPNVDEYALVEEALKAWTEDALFSPYFHQPGKVGLIRCPAISNLMHGSQLVAASTSASKKELREDYDLLLKHTKSAEWLEGKSAIVEKVPQLAQSPIDVSYTNQGSDWSWKAQWVAELACLL